MSDYPFDVVDLGDPDHVAEGERAPDFTRPLVSDEFWEDVSLSDLTDEGPVLLVFFPMDGTGAAQYTWIELRERGWGGDDLTVVGVSVCSPYEHRAFIDDHRLPYRLFSDPANGVAETYGVVHDYDGMAGLAGARPAFYLLDSEMRVEYCWVTTEWPASIDYDAVERAMAGLTGSE